MTRAEQFRRVTERLDTYREQVIELQRQLVSRVALGPEVGGTAKLFLSSGTKIIYDGARKEKPGGPRR